MEVGHASATPSLRLQTDRAPSAAGNGELLLDRQHVGEQIAELVDPFEHVVAGELADHSDPSAHASTSSHVTGVDTVGSGRARSEYGAIVVLWNAF